MLTFLFQYSCFICWGYFAFVAKKSYIRCKLLTFEGKNFKKNDQMSSTINRKKTKIDP